MSGPLSASTPLSYKLEPYLLTNVSVEIAMSYLLVYNSTERWCSGRHGKQILFALEEVNASFICLQTFFKYQLKRLCKIKFPRVYSLDHSAFS